MKREVADMLVLVLSLLCWTPTEGSCRATIVRILGESMELSVGEGFSLRCEFMCLGAQHVAQLWRNSRNQDGSLVSLVNVTSIFPNVSLALNICSATKADAGFYSCRTQPPDTISPSVEIKIADNLTTTQSFQPTNSSHQPSSTDEHSRPCGVVSPKGLQGQIWYWLLLGKTAILFLSLASLAVKYKTG